MTRHRHPRLPHLLTALLTTLLTAGILTLPGLAAATDVGNFAPVTPDRALSFPRDFGAHPDYRTEWWYITGWLTDAQGRERGFQVTFFRSATGIGADNPSRFAPRQLLLAHAAIADPGSDHLRHAERAARVLPPLTGAEPTDTQVWIGDWTLRRTPNGGSSEDTYRTRIEADDFAFDLTLTPAGPPVLNGQAGFSQKSPNPQDASHYYSRPQLEVTGELRLVATGNGSEKGKGNSPAHRVTGRAWLDHEWSTAYLPEQAQGWDWIGINLHDGGSLMAYRMRRADDSTLWAGGTLLRPGQPKRVLGPDEICFTPRRHWQSPRTGTRYPVEWTLEIDDLRLRLRPLMDDQELDSRRSTQTIYWEGAVRVLKEGAAQDSAVETKPEPTEIGRGYLEMTGYWQRQSSL
ncbi:lipocalin-like domain-containing protein [Rhabdochromatium marinum]|uniref:lipocalin-like domain-containing protein n=1 Tax=Rhabdochromatium marinum TaxID=48729 RepID=UPI0019085B82|nr:carotenoid 1,2-hydratase [Rhabdochromatium marinum]MBK1648563.1 carotenoid 1,2-hydratase [Rhabdochromatium marinum]